MPPCLKLLHQVLLCCFKWTHTDILCPAFEIRLSIQQMLSLLQRHIYVFQYLPWQKKFWGNCTCRDLKKKHFPKNKDLYIFVFTWFHDTDNLGSYPQMLVFWFLTFVALSYPVSKEQDKERILTLSSSYKCQKFNKMNEEAWSIRVLVLNMQLGK